MAGLASAGVAGGRAGRRRGDRARGRRDRRRDVRAQPLPAAGAGGRDAGARGRRGGRRRGRDRGRAGEPGLERRATLGVAADHAAGRLCDRRLGRARAARRDRRAQRRPRPSGASCGCWPRRRGSRTARPTSTTRCGGWSTCSCPTSPTPPGSTVLQPGGGAAAARGARRRTGPRGARGVAARARILGAVGPLADHARAARRGQPARGARRAPARRDRAPRGRRRPPPDGAGRSCAGRWRCRSRRAAGRSARSGSASGAPDGATVPPSWRSPSCWSAAPGSRSRTPSSSTG